MPRSGVKLSNAGRTVLNAALNQAVKWQLLARNPVYGTIPKKVVSRPQTIWTPDQIRRLLQEASQHRLYALFYLLFTTGLRQGEVLALRWEDVEEDAIVVRRSIDTRKGRVIESEPKSKGSRRVVAIDPTTRQLLREHAERQSAELATLGMTPNEVPQRVFTNHLGGTINASNLTKIWHQLQDKAGLPRARFHDGRHMHLSMLIANGVDIRTVADRAGHADSVLTLRLYAHALEAQRRRAAIPLDELLGD